MNDPRETGAARPGAHAPPIDDHRVLGDGCTTALLRPDGEVDWWCAPLPHDAPLLWSLLDPDGGASRFLDVVPRLPAGTFLHVHDITLPDAYPEAWAWRGYNEQLLVGALMQGGAFEPIFASHFVKMTHPLPETVKQLPLQPGWDCGSQGVCVFLHCGGLGMVRRRRKEEG